MNAYLILRNQTKRLPFSTAQMLLKEGLARIHQYYPLTLKLKTNEKPFADPDFDELKPNDTPSMPPLAQKRRLQEFA